MHAWTGSGSILITSIPYEVLAILDRQFQLDSAVRKNTKDVQPLPSADNLSECKNSLYSVNKYLHAPKSHFLSLLNTGGLNTMEERCSLHCTAISHIGLCPWLPPSISILSLLTTVECHLCVLPAALSTLQLSGVTMKDSHCHS